MRSRIFLLLTALAVVNLAHAQNTTPYWSLSGNSNASSSSKMGTTNSIPLRLFSNNVERLRIATDGKVGIGSVSPIGKLTLVNVGSSIPAAPWGAASALFTGFGEGTSGRADFIINMASNTGSLRPVYIGKKSRGTLAAPLAVANGDQVFSFLGSAYDGGTFQYPAAIDFRVDGATSSGRVPVGIAFFTGVNGGTRQERLRIGSNGNFAFNGNQLAMTYGREQVINLNDGQFVATMDTLEEYSSIDIKGGVAISASDDNTYARYALDVNALSIDAAFIKSEANGLRVESGLSGIDIKSGSDGIFVNSAQGKGVVVNAADDYGIDVIGRNVGVYVKATDEEDSGTGVLAFAGGSGLRGIALEDGPPFDIEFRGSAGVFGTNRNYGAGVRGVSPRGIGVSGTSTEYHGVYGTTQSTTSYAGYFDGKVFSSGGFVSASDARLKQGIKDLPIGLSIIGKLQPKSYSFRHDEAAKTLNLPQGEHYGLLAQDLEKVLPNLVHDVEFNPNNSIAPPDIDSTGKAVSRAASAGKPTQYKAINYTELIPLLIKGMQEQQAQIEEQQQTITAQNETNEQLQKRVEKLEQMVNQLSRGSQQMSLQSGYLSMATPNPSNGSALVTYQVPQGSSKAQIIVTDMKGVVLRSMNIAAQGNGQVNINTAALAAGTYTYSLVVDGAKLDSKQLMVAR